MVFLTIVKIWKSHLIKPILVINISINQSKNIITVIVKTKAAV